MRHVVAAKLDIDDPIINAPTKTISVRDVLYGDADEIARKDIRVGDTVVLQRGGDGFCGCCVRHVLSVRRANLTTSWLACPGRAKRDPEPSRLLKKSVAPSFEA